MNVRQLRSFIQIAELGSVTRAAAFLHIAQPALSRQIRQLEEELGVTLFQRSDRGVTLTGAGTLLRERATVLLQHIERVRQDVRDGFNEPSGQLTVAMPPSMFDLVTVPLVLAYRERYPNVLLRIIEGISGILNAWHLVELGKADLAIVTNVEPLATFETMPFLYEPLCLIGPRQAAFCASREIGLDEVSRHQLVLTGRPNSLRLVLETAMARLKLPMHVAMEASTPQLLLTAVEQGLGYAVLPSCSAYRWSGEGRVTFAPIAGLTVSWTTVQARDQPLSAAGDRLKAMLAQIVRKSVMAGAWPLATLIP